MNTVWPGGLFFTACILVLAFSMFISALMRLRSVPAILLSFYLVSFSNIVFVGEIAGTFNLLRSQFFFLFVHLVLAVLAGIVWWRNGRQPLLGPISNVLSKYSIKDLLATIKEWPGLFTLSIAVGVIYLFGIYLILKVPPNNYDSMTCHMTRIGYWLQHGNFWPWSTWDYTQKVYPITAQVPMMWTILFWGGDQWTGFSQWFAALAGMLVVFGLARLLGWSRPQSAFAALIWAFLPEILLESTTVQNHLTVGVCFACALYFLFLGIKSGAIADLILSGLALGLSLGTHQLTFFILPGLFLTICMVWFKYKHKVTKYLIVWGVASLFAFMLVGSYMYIVNFSLYGNPFAPGIEVKLPQKDNQPQSEALSGAAANFVAGLIINTSRYVYSSLDITGLPNNLSEPILHLRTQIGSYIFGNLNIPIEHGKGFRLVRAPTTISEDIAWFGLIGFIFFPPLLIIQVAKGIKTRDILRLGIFFTVIIYVSIWSGMIIGTSGAWSPYQGRYYIIIVTMISPFIASLLKPGRFFNLIGWLLVIASIFTASYITVNNQAKPLTGPLAIWNLDRIEKQNLNSGEFIVMLNKVEKIVPSDETLGLVLVKGTYEYPLFGKRLTRTLVPIYPDEKLSDSSWIKQKGINWILICKPLSLPENFVEISAFPAFLGKGCQLLKRVP